MRTEVLAVAFVGALGCTDLPPRFAGAQPIELFQAPCSETENDSEPVITEARIDEDAEVVAEATGVGFRCAQEVCGFSQQTGATAEVLLQPCNMHPLSLPGCSCLYEFDFKFFADPSEGARTLDLWTRPDGSGSDGPNEPSLIDSAPIEGFDFD
jgi:hypothetical protein